MVIAGFGALASLGLALPTGMAFGYGYGYGVRQGYHAFKPSQNQQTKDLHLSPNPVTGAQGAGLLSAEEMTSKQTQKIQPIVPISQSPSPPTQADTVTQAVNTQEKRYWSNKGQGPLHWTKAEIFARGEKHGLDRRTSWRKYANGEYPFIASYRDKAKVHGRR